MSYLLSMIICSGLTASCMPPITLKTMYADVYSCMIAGYEEAKSKMILLGPEEINNNQIYIKFRCSELIIPLPKPGVKT